jgi:ferredoxin
MQAAEVRHSVTRAFPYPNDIEGQMKVRIDQQRCRGHARCLDIAPDAFDFIDEEDRAIVVDDGVRRTDVAALIEAQEECPEQAIQLEADNVTDPQPEGPK